MMNRLPFIFFTLLLLLGMNSDCFSGNSVVLTMDGKRFTGVVRMDSGRLVVVDSEKAQVVPVSATNLFQVILDARREPADVRLEGRSSDGDLMPAWGDTVIGGGSRKVVDVSRGQFRMKADGTDARNSADQFHFAYKSITGNHEIMARVLNARRGEMAGVMMRDSLDPGGRHVMLGIHWGRGATLRWREDGRWSTQSKSISGARGASWVKLKRYGDTFIVYRSSRGQTWKEIHRLTLSMSADYYVGLSAGMLDPRFVRSIDFPDVSRIDQVRVAPSLPISSFIPQVRLRSGTIVAGRMEASGSMIGFPGRQVKPDIRVYDVASLNFQYLPTRLSRKVEFGQPGVYLLNGEFIEGRLQGIRDGMVSISSVLFGVRQYDLNSEIRAVVLRATAVTAPTFEVSTTDGSHWLASRLEVGKNEVFIWEPLLGRIAIPAYKITEIKRTTDRG